jgi:hypothetical protein
LISRNSHEGGRSEYGSQVPPCTVARLSASNEATPFGSRAFCSAVSYDGWARPKSKAAGRESLDTEHAIRLPPGTRKMPRPKSHAICTMTAAVVIVFPQGA